MTYIIYFFRLITAMEQFSHDLTLALEETSKCSRRWGIRRRTRSTGNLRECLNFFFLKIPIKDYINFL